VIEIVEGGELAPLIDPARNVDIATSSIMYRLPEPLRATALTTGGNVAADVGVEWVTFELFRRTGRSRTCASGPCDRTGPQETTPDQVVRR